MPTPDPPPNNPYIAGNPLKGQEMFFGHDDIFEKVRANLVGEHQDNAIVIYGQRRTGKTSVLYQMERRLNAAEGRERYVAVLVDLQRFGLKDLENFLWQLAGTIWRDLRRDYKLERPERAAFKNDARHAFRDGFLPSVRTPLGERSLLLMFDEAIRLQEAVAQNKLPPAFFAYLRSFIEHEDNISFIFSLDRKPESLPPEYSRMLNVAASLHVSFLNERAARSLVTEPVAACYTFADDALEYLLALTSRHPYFTQVICHTLFTRWEQQELERITCAEIDAVLEEATNLCVVNLKYSWDEATAAQKFVLAALAEVEADKVSLATLKQHLQQAELHLGDNEISGALAELLLREVIDWPTPHFHVMLLRRWVRREKALPLVRDELAEHLPEPPIFVQKSKEADEYRAQGQGDYYHKASYTLNHLVRQGLVLEQDGAYTLFSTIFAEWIRHELHNSQTPSQSYQDWLNEPPTQNRLTRLKDGVVGEVTEHLLPAINEKYRELIIGWLTENVSVENVIGLFGF